MLSERPHSVTVSLPSAEPDATGINQTDEYPLSYTVLTQITPMSAAKAFESYGVELHRPHLCMFNLEDAAKFADGAKVVKGTRTFYVKSKVDRWEQGDTCDHASCLLEEYIG